MSPQPSGSEHVARPTTSLPRKYQEWENTLREIATGKYLFAPRLKCNLANIEQEKKVYTTQNFKLLPELGLTFIPSR